MGYSCRRRSGRRTRRLRCTLGWAGLLLLLVLMCGVQRA